MTFADMVLARAALELLNERQIELVLDALEGSEVVIDARDWVALEAFVRVVCHELGPTPAAAEVQVAFGVGRYAALN